MSDSASGGKERRSTLSRESVLRGAIALADAGGVGSLTIRSLAQQLGAKPMSLYYYVAGKDEILDGIVDLVFAEIELPSPHGEWRAEMLRRANSARDALRRHSWAIGLMESRKNPGPATLRHHDAVLGALRGAGFSVELAGHAYALLDSYIYGFALQEASLPFQGPEDAGEVAETMMQDFAVNTYPHLVELTAEYVLQPGYDFGNEFDFGIDIILNGLSQSLAGQKSLIYD